jgi:predicted nucleic-acid-binding Zn-ribbon protein
MSKFIECPHCHCQYTPEEIFVRGAFIGKTKDIVKDALGKILYSDYEEGKEPDFNEKFICDNCNRTFLIHADISYSTEAEKEELDFSEEYVKLL